MQQPKVNIIFDSRQNEDYGRLLSEFITQEIVNYKFWDAIIYTDSVIKSINASHKMIVRAAKDNKEIECVVAEQDLEFSSPNSLKYFLENKPQTFDVYIGGSYLIDDRNEYKAPLVKVNEWIGNHFYIISEKYYDKFLALPDDHHIDIVQKGLGDFYLCYPMVALQRPGFSANNHADVNYNLLLREEDIYKQ